MFHAILSNSVKSIPPSQCCESLELHYKIVSEGYMKFIDKLSWPVGMEVQDVKSVSLGG